MRRVNDQLVEGLLVRAHQVERSEPAGRDPAGGGLTLPDLVAVHDEHFGSASSQLAGHGQPGEAGAANQDVAVPV